MEKSKILAVAALVVLGGIIYLSKKPAIDKAEKTEQAQLSRVKRKSEDLGYIKGASLAGSSYGEVV